MTEITGNKPYSPIQNNDPALNNNPVSNADSTIESLPSADSIATESISTMDHTSLSYGSRVKHLLSSIATGIADGLSTGIDTYVVSPKTRENLIKGFDQVVENVSNTMDAFIPKSVNLGSKF